MIDLNWDSVYVWVLAAVAVDCGYYWFHRASHEIGFLWAVHQVAFNPPKSEHQLCTVQYGLKQSISCVQYSMV